jgi:heterodisulfide reductase subunit A
LEWISAAEGVRFAQVMRKMEELRRTVTADEVKETRRIVQENLKEKKSRRKKAV